MSNAHPMYRPPPPAPCAAGSLAPAPFQPFKMNPINPRKRPGAPGIRGTSPPYKHGRPSEPAGAALDVNSSPRSPERRSSLPTSRHSSITHLRDVPTGPASNTYDGYRDYYRPESHRPDSYRPDSNRPDSNRPDSYRFDSYRPDYRKDNDRRPSSGTLRSSSAHSATTRIANTDGTSPSHITMSPLAVHGEGVSSGSGHSTPIQGTARVARVPPVAPMATDKTLNPPIQPENSATNPPELMRIINGAYNAGRAEDYQNRLQKNGVPTTSVDIASLKRSRERKSQISQDQFQKYKAPLQQYLSTGKVTSDAAGADENGSSIPGNSHFASMDEKLTIMELEIENLKKKNEILAEQLKGATTAPKLGEPQICALVQEQVRSASQQNFTSLISDKLPEIIQEAQKAAAAMVEQSVQTIVKAQIGEGMKDITKIKEDLQRLDAFKERVEDANLPHLNDRLSKLETLEKRLAKVEGAEASVHDIAQDIKDELKSVKNDRLSKLETLEKRLTKVEGTEASVHDITQDIKDELKSVKNDQHALESSYKDSMHKLESSVESTSKTASLLDDKFTAVFKSASQVVEAQQVATEAQQAAAEAQTTVTQLEAKMKEMEQSVSMKHEVARTTTKLEARIKALEQSTLNLDQPRNTQYEIAQTTQKFERGLNEVQTNLSKTNEDLNLLNNALAQAEDGLLNAKIDIETLKEQAPRLVDDYLSKTGARSEGYENRLRDLAHQFVDLSGKVEILEQRPVEAQLTLSHPVATTLLKKIEETAQSLHQLHGSRLDNMSSELQKLQGAITDTLNQNALAIRDLEHRYQQISTDQLYHNIMHWVTENYADVPGLAAQLGSVQTSIKDIRTRVSTVESWSEVVERVGTNWQSITESIRSIMQIESRLLENQNGIVKVEATLTDLSKNLIHRAELKAICEAIQQHINHERSESVARDEALGMRIDPLARNVQKVESAIGQVNDVLGFKEDIVKACGRFPFQEARLGNIESMIRDLNANSDNPLRGMNFDVQPHT